jgi:hypothetical protein
MTKNMAPYGLLLISRTEDFLKTEFYVRISVLNKHVIIKTLIQTSHLSKETEPKGEITYPANRISEARAALKEITLSKQRMFYTYNIKFIEMSKISFCLAFLGII